MRICGVIDTDTVKTEATEHNFYPLLLCWLNENKWNRCWDYADKHDDMCKEDHNKSTINIINYLIKFYISNDHTKTMKYCLFIIINKQIATNSSIF